MGNKSSSKPTYTKQQKMLLEWGEQNIIPMAEGKETILGRRLEQQAMDITESQRQASTQNIMGAKMSMANKALDMISGVPLAPGQTSKTKEGAASIFGKVAGGVGSIASGAGGLMGGMGALTSVSDIGEASAGASS